MPTFETYCCCIGSTRRTLTSRKSSEWKAGKVSTASNFDKMAPVKHKVCPNWRWRTTSSMRCTSRSSGISTWAVKVTWSVAALEKTAASARYPLRLPLGSWRIWWALLYESVSCRLRSLQIYDPFEWHPYFQMYAWYSVASAAMVPPCQLVDSDRKGRFRSCRPR